MYYNRGGDVCVCLDGTFFLQVRNKLGLKLPHLDSGAGFKNETVEEHEIVSWKLGAKRSVRACVHTFHTEYALWVVELLPG